MEVLVPVKMEFDFLIKSGKSAFLNSETNMGTRTTEVMKSAVIKAAGTITTKIKAPAVTPTSGSADNAKYGDRICTSLCMIPKL